MADTETETPAAVVPAKVAPAAAKPKVVISDEKPEPEAKKAPMTKRTKLEMEAGKAAIAKQA